MEDRLDQINQGRCQLELGGETNPVVQRSALIVLVAVAVAATVTVTGLSRLGRGHGFSLGSIIEQKDIKTEIPYAKRLSSSTWLIP